MRKVWVRGSLLVAIALSLSGCSSKGDIGKPCTLIRADPTDDDPNDGIRNIPVRESEVNANQDYVSFGATECEDFTCVRRAGATITGDPDAVAAGVCSKNCLPDADLEEQCPAFNDEVQVTCRALILDRDTIAAICRDNPEKCQSTFGDNRSSEFCIEAGGTADGT